MCFYCNVHLGNSFVLSGLFFKITANKQYKQHTCKCIKELIDFKVCVCARARWTFKRGSGRWIPLFCFYFPAYMIQFVFYHIHQHLVIDVVVIVPGALAIGPRFNSHPQLHQLVRPERVEGGAQLLALVLEQLQQVLLFHTGVVDQHIQGQGALHTIETTHYALGQALQGCRHLAGTAVPLHQELSHCQWRSAVQQREGRWAAANPLQPSQAGVKHVICCAALWQVFTD